MNARIRAARESLPESQRGGGRYSPPPHDDYFLVDGGTADASGIAALARRGVKRIVAFYNEINDLHDLSAQRSEHSKPL